jgi:hypothetical protein
MSDANTIRVSYDAALLSAFVSGSTAPSPTTTGQILRITGESLKRNTTSTESAELRSDRSISDLIRTNVGADGDINFELSYSTFDDFFQMLMMESAWTAADDDNDVSTLAITSGGVTSSGSADPLLGIVVGDIVMVNYTVGSTKYTKVARLVSKTSDKVGTLAPWDTEVTSGQCTRISRGSYLQNDVDLRYTHLEKKFVETGLGSNVYENMYYATVNQMSLNIPSDGIINGSFSLMGRDSVTSSTSIDSGTPDPATTTDVMNAIDNVEAVWIENASGALTAQTALTSLSMSVNNNLRSRNTISLLGAESIGTGTMAISGTLQAYYRSIDLYQAHENFTAKSVATILKDSDSGATYGNANYYAFDFPRVKFGSGQRVAGGRNQDIIADLGYTAIISNYGTNDREFRIYRWPAT